MTDAPKPGPSVSEQARLLSGAQPASDAETYAWECAENMKGWALRAEESNRELRAECRRLREQLDAARQALEKIASGEIVTRSRGLSNAIIDGKSASVEYVEKMSARDVARAALGVVGEADDE